MASNVPPAAAAAPVAAEAPPAVPAVPAAPAVDEEEVLDAELEAMKKRLREMEEEAAKLKDIQEQSSAELSGTPAGAPAVGAGPAAAAGGPAAAAAATAETDARSIYVGSVDYSATPEELQAHFADCGTVNRVTILCNKFTGHPKGYAYIEFADEDGVKNATILNDSMFKDRQIKVVPKRSNVPGMGAEAMYMRGRGRGRGRGGFRGGGYRGGGYRGGYRGGYGGPQRWAPY